MCIRDSNLPVLQTADSFGLDVGIDGGFLTAEEMDDAQWDGSVSLVGYLPVTKRITPFVAVSAGSAWVESFNNSAFIYGGTVGVEFDLTDKWSATVSTGILHDNDADDDQWNASASVTYWATEQVGFGLDYSYSDNDFVDVNYVGASFSVGL